MVGRVPYEPQSAQSLDAMQLAQWASNEFRRIADAIRPVRSGVCLTETHSINIGSSLNWQAQYTGSASEDWQDPIGGWSNPLWTCQLDGMYLITSRTEIAGFGAGSTNYYIGCRLTLDPISGDPDDVIGYLQGGPDDMPLAAHNLQVMELFRGDTIKHEITAVHASQGGTVSTVNRLAIIKIDEV